MAIPVIDFSGLDLEQLGTEKWNTARAQAVQALESYGCFEAQYDKITPELREAVFGIAMKEAFSLPLETKTPTPRYIGQIPGMPYESLAMDATLLDSVETYTKLLWPQGNPSFCDSMWSYAKHLAELEQMVRRMVLESFGIEKYYDDQVKSTTYALRLAEYGVPEAQENKIGLPAHRDMNTVTIVCQHKGQGLEVETKDGEWIHAVSSRNSFNVMVGEALWAWSNGRLHAPLHQVRIANTEKRYSTVFNSHPPNTQIIQAPEELVDEEHPLLFKPYEYGEYLRFYYSEAGQKEKCPLKTFCGVGGEGIEA